MSESEKEFDYNSVHNLEGTLPDTRLESTASIIKDVRGASRRPTTRADHPSTPTTRAPTSSANLW